MPEKPGNAKVGLTKVRSNAASRMPKPRLFPETGNGNIRDSGESVVNSNNKARQAPEIPTKSPLPNKR